MTEQKQKQSKKAKDQGDQNMNQFNNKQISSGLAGAPNIKSSSIMEGINNTSRSLRVLEERYINLRRRIQVSDENMLANHKKIISDVKHLNESLTDVKRELTSLKSHSGMIMKELSACAKKTDLAVLDRYLSFWDPTSFLSYEQAEKLINKIVNSPSNCIESESINTKESKDSIQR